jgi:hypothetical protein
VLGGKDGLGWKPEGYKGGGKQENFNYTYGFYFPGAQEGVHYFTGKLETPAESLGQTQADDQSFTIRAAANLVNNHVPDIWQIDETRKIDHVQNGID